MSDNKNTMALFARDGWCWTKSIYFERGNDNWYILVLGSTNYAALQINYNYEWCITTYKNPCTTTITGLLGMVDAYSVRQEPLELNNKITRL